MYNVNSKTNHISDKRLINYLLGLCLISSNAVAFASIETEFNDNFLAADAATPGINSGINSGIIGDLTSASNDVDIWRFNLTAGSGIGASISDGPGTDYNSFDPIIILFMEEAGDYYPVAANDPFSFSTSFGFTPWQSGTYYLTVSSFQNSPQDAFNNNQFDSQFWTDSVSFGTAFDHYQGNSFNSFDYSLNLTGAVSTVPVPAAVWLFTSGLLGLVGMARRYRVPR